ncbi:MAG: hypothetical protein LW860_21180 [Xanthomonadaceae bacterium]|jgi:hypothetical protein|nr:hypothetical protein [Xanthomonadaceae bacterium]
MRLIPFALFALFALANAATAAEPPPVAAKADAAAAAPAEVAPAAPPPIFPSVHIDIEPGSDTGQFLAGARVFDLNSRRVLATPQMTLQQGTPASTEVEGPDGAFKVRIEAGVDPTGTSAQWSYTITEQGIVIAEARGTVTLSRPREAGY